MLMRRLGLPLLLTLGLFTSGCSGDDADAEDAGQAHAGNAGKGGASGKGVAGSGGLGGGGGSSGGGGAASCTNVNAGMLFPTCIGQDEYIACVRERQRCAECSTQCADFHSCVKNSPDPCNHACTGSKTCVECIVMMPQCAGAQSCMQFLSCISETADEGIRPGGACDQLDDCCDTLDERADECKEYAPAGRNRGDEMGCRPFLNEFCPESLKLL